MQIRMEIMINMPLQADKMVRGRQIAPRFTGVPDSSASNRS
jgi:hypothetical protein